MSEFSPKVSIVIPVYNGSNYLCEAIDSALAQTYKNIEVIVVNDGSSDDGATERIALSYGDRIRYFRKENGGVASALNLGIREMRGEYFSWLSHDDVYYPDKVEVQIEWLRRHEGHRNVVLYGDYDVINARSQVVKSVRGGGWKPHQFCIALIFSNPLHGCDALIPKTCLTEVGSFNESLRTTNDYDMWYRLARRFDFIHIQRAMIQGRDHGERDCYSLMHVQKREVTSLFKWMLDELPQCDIEDYSPDGSASFYLRCATAYIGRDSVPAAFYALKKALPNFMGKNGCLFFSSMGQLGYFVVYSVSKIGYRFFRRAVGKYRKPLN